MLRLVLVLWAVLTATAAHAETYRLVHAIGNDEKTAAKGLTKAECEAMKEERKNIAKAMGIGGSITCLPDSFFDD